MWYIYIYIYTHTMEFYCLKVWHMLQYGWSVKTLWMESESHSVVSVTPWTVVHQASLSMEFSRQEHWSGLPLSSPGGLPNPGMEPGSPTLYADSLPSELQWPVGEDIMLHEISQIKKTSIGASMVVQRLGLHAFTARGMGLIPALGTKIPHATWYGQKVKKKERERDRETTLL